MRQLLGCVVLTVAIAVPGSAQSIAGRWNAEMNTPGGAVPFGLVFRIHGDTVDGTVQRAAGDQPLHGAIARDTVTFSYTIDYNGNPLTLTMTARIFADSLAGVVDFDGNGTDRFHATRAKVNGDSTGIRRVRR